MSNEKHYPLHPSHAEPMYIQISRDTFDSMSAELEELRKLVVPTDLLKAEIDSLKREIDMYKSITQGDKTTIDDVVEINTLTSEVKALREMNAKLQGEKIQLEAENRWHRCDKPNSDGLYDLPPESGEYVIQYELNGKKYVTSGTYEADYNDWNELRYGSNVIQWRELPHPKE